MLKMFKVSHPVLCAMIVVVCASAMPVFFWLGGAVDSPFLFSGIWQISGGIGVGAVALVQHRKLLLGKAVRTNLKSHCLKRAMLGSIVGNCGISLFPLGGLFVNFPTAAILYETRPLFWSLEQFLRYSFRNFMSAGYRVAILVVPAIAGAVLVVSSNHDTPQLLPAIGAVFCSPGIWFGVFLVLAAAFLFSVRLDCALDLGWDLAKIHSDSKKNDEEQLRIIFTKVMNCISLVVAGGVLCVISLIMSESISMHQVIYAIMGGIVFWFGAAAYDAWRERINFSKAKVAGIFAITILYLRPLFVLLGLWMISILDGSYLDYLIIGTLGISVSMMLFRADESRGEAKGSSRRAYKALIVSLWVFGIITYVFEGYTTKIPLELPVTVFILILAFRVARLVQRTGEEEGWVIDVFHRLRFLASKMQTRPAIATDLHKACESLMKVDCHDSAEDLMDAYEELIDKLESIRMAVDKETEIQRVDQHESGDELAKALVRQLERVGTAGGITEELTEIRRLVDRLAHSLQQGSRIDEFVTILLTAMLIVTGLLFFNGDRDLFGDFTSFLLSSVVVFLLVNIMDLEKDRRDETLKKNRKEKALVDDRIVEALKKDRIDETLKIADEYLRRIKTLQVYVVNFEHPLNREKERFSAFISVVIVIVFGLVFFAAS